MGVNELMMIVLVGLALFGGAIKVKFKGLARRKKSRELKGGEPKLLDE